jgi:tetratricopeptide (TPR) repeat protein
MISGPRIRLAFPGAVLPGAALGSLGQVEGAAGNYDRAEQLLHEALALCQKQGDVGRVALDQQSLAAVSLRAGRIQEARDLLAGTLDYATRSGDAEFLADALELSACIAADRGDASQAARLTGAAEGIRQQTGILRAQPDAALLERFLAPARNSMTPDAWDAELAAGQALSQQQAAGLLRSAAQRA